MKMPDMGNTNEYPNGFYSFNNRYTSETSLQARYQDTSYQQTHAFDPRHAFSSNSGKKDKLEQYVPVNASCGKDVRELTYTLSELNMDSTLCRQTSIGSIKNQAPRSPIIHPISPLSPFTTAQKTWSPPPLSLGTPVIVAQSHPPVTNTQPLSRYDLNGQTPSPSFGPIIGRGIVDNASNKNSPMKHPNRKESEALAKYKGMKISDFKGKMYKISKDQTGCRYVQSLIDQDPKIIGTILDEIYNKIPDIIIDPFGNYLCQKICERADEKNMNRFVNSLKKRLVDIAVNTHGTRVAQKLVDNIQTNHQMKIVSNALRDNVVELIKDLNGNHVIQKCLTRFNHENNQFIYDSISRNCIIISCDKHGCCVIQRCIDYSSDRQKTQLIEQILSCVETMIQASLKHLDPYGNYVIQYILDLQDPRFTNDLVKHLVGKVIPYSMQKYSSNVVEKCIKTKTPYRNILVQDISKKQSLEKLVRDPFGNYVVQTAMEFADPRTRMQRKIIQNVLPILPVLRTTQHGRRMEVKINQYLVQGCVQVNPLNHQ